MNLSEDKVGAVLVIGGGIGGIQAALDLAESGYKVYLLEKSPAIGGVMAQLERLSILVTAPCVSSPQNLLNVEDTLILKYFPTQNFLELKERRGISRQ